MEKLDSFTRAYCECVLWSSTDNSDESGGNPLDRNFGVEDIAPETLARMVQDCATFREANAADLASVEDMCDDDRAGHDFWLNRNGHGSGFWDEYFGDDADLRAAFRRLSDASKVYGSSDLYVGDDGQIHGS